jgi:D-lyxose ketol-isomerase
VDILDHDQEYQGSDVYNIDEYKTPQLSGGEHAWDLITRDDQAIASGLYLFTVKNLDNESLSYGKVKEGKFLIIK